MTDLDKLSPHYRTDESGGIDPALSQYLDENYFRKLNNVNKTNPKLLVVFSGGNAVGKSTLSKKIGDELDGLVIENDAIRRSIIDMMPDVDRSKQIHNLTWQYTKGLYPRLDSMTENGLIVRDGIIDWYFDRILPSFPFHELFIVAYDLSREKSIELIGRRGDTPTAKADGLYQLIGDHDIHTKRFRSQFSPDVVLDDDNVFDHDIVVSLLRKRVSELRNIKN